MHILYSPLFARVTSWSRLVKGKTGLCVVKYATKPLVYVAKTKKDPNRQTSSNSFPDTVTNILSASERKL